MYRNGHDYSKTIGLKAALLWQGNPTGKRHFNTTCIRVELEMTSGPFFDTLS